MTKKRKRSNSLVLSARDVAAAGQPIKKQKPATAGPRVHPLQIDTARVEPTGSQFSHRDQTKQSTVTDASIQQLSRSALKRRRKKRKSGQSISQSGALMSTGGNRLSHKQVSNTKTGGSKARFPSFTKSKASKVDIPGPSNESGPRSPLLGRVLSFDEPPPGLNSKARKRWRQRHRRKSGSSTTTALNIDNILLRHGYRIRDGTVPQQRLSTVALPSHSHVEKLVQQVTRTSLAQRPRKEWRQDHKYLPAAFALAASSVAIENDTSSAASGDQHNPAESQSHSMTVSAESNAEGLVDAESYVENAVSSRIRQPKILAIPPRSPPVQYISGLSRFKQAMSSGPASSIGEIPRIGASHGHKATSVPSYDNTLDPTTAFKRFSAFMSGRNDSSSGSSSEESDSEESDRDESSDSSAVDMSRTRAEANQRHQPSNRKPHPIIEEDEVGQAEEHDITSSSNNSQDKSTLTRGISANAQTSSYQANEKRKRFTNTAERPAEDARENLLPDFTLAEQQRDITSSQTRPTLHLQESSSLEDIGENILSQTIDEISHGVFHGTLALPFSKAHSANLTHLPEKTTAFLTKALSDYKSGMNAPSVVTSDESCRQGFLPAIVCNSVRVLEQDPAMHWPNPALEVFNGAKASDTSLREAEQRFPHDVDTNLSRSESPLSELGKTPSPPPEITVNQKPSADKIVSTSTSAQPEHKPTLRKKRSMTGLTSKHFSPSRTPRTNGTPKVGGDEEENTSTARRTRSAAKRAHDDGRVSSSKHLKSVEDPLNFSSEDQDDESASENLVTPAKKRKVVAGVSNAPVPPISAERFGILQEKLWREPFKLIIAVTFLNKTAGRSAAPVFWRLMERYPTVDDLANADRDDLFSMIWQLGLGNQRSKRLIEIAKAWSAQPPEKSRRYRTLHYPNKEDGKQFKKSDVVGEDANVCDGALEIGHIPGCGRYAWDSWRICCRDVLRGVAEDYNGKNATQSDFEPEWKRVVPEDKELRACLRWMWLREGWIWDCHNGSKRPATEEEMEKARRGEMEVSDHQELKFAAQAAGVDIKKPAVHAADDIVKKTPLRQADDNEDGARTTKGSSEKSQPSTVRQITPEAGTQEGNSSDNIVVSPRLRLSNRKARSNR